MSAQHGLYWSFRMNNRPNVEATKSWIREQTAGGKRRHKKAVLENLPKGVTLGALNQAREELIQEGYLLSIGGYLEPSKSGLMLALDLLERLIDRGEELTVKQISKQGGIKVATLNVAFGILRNADKAMLDHKRRVCAPPRKREVCVKRARFRSYCPQARAVQILEEDGASTLAHIVSASGGDRASVLRHLNEMVEDGEVQRQDGLWRLV